MLSAPTDKVDDILYMQLATARIEYERAKVELQISTAKLKIAERKAKHGEGTGSGIRSGCARWTSIASMRRKEKETAESTLTYMQHEARCINIGIPTIS